MKQPTQLTSSFTNLFIMYFIDRYLLTCFFSFLVTPPTIVPDSQSPNGSVLPGQRSWSLNIDGQVCIKNTFTYQGRLE